MIQVFIKRYWCVLALGTLTFNSYALDCSKVDIKEIAKESVIRELKGASLSSRPKCLDEHRFNYVRPLWRPPVESERIFDIGVLDNTLKITEVKLEDDFVGQYKVQYEAKADKHFGGKVHKSEITIVTKLEGRMLERNGCALTLVSPKKSMLMRSCYEKVLKAKGIE